MSEILLSAQNNMNQFVNIKEQFREYLSNCVKSGRSTNTSFIIGRTAVDSYVSFAEVDKLFDYNPELWSEISSIYDIISSQKILEIIKKLSTDENFTKKDTEGTSQYYRSNAIKQYYCFLKAREIIIGQNTMSSHSLPFPPELKEYYQRHLNLPHQQIFYGAPGTGKSHTIKETTKGCESDCIFRTTFHPDSDYSTFVGAYKPTMVSVPRYGLNGSTTVPFEVDGKPLIESRIEYRFVKQAFLKAYIAAWRVFCETPLAEDNKTAPIFLVIEEINRGNCAQIFGDLFQLLDRKNGFSQYPIHTDEDVRKCLMSKHTDEDPSFGGGLEFSDEQKALINSVLDCKYDVAEKIARGEVLVLPPNLYIWATMNTSDQSLFPIDSAFKRRWEWKYSPIKNHEEENYKIVIGSKTYDWWGFLEKINRVIDDTTNSEDKKLGYFFAKSDDKVISAEKFVGKVLFYLWNDVFKDFGFDTAIFSKEDGKNFVFSDFFEKDGSPNVDMVNTFLESLDKNIDKEKPFQESRETEEGDDSLADGAEG